MILPHKDIAQLKIGLILGFMGIVTLGLWNQAAVLGCAGTDMDAAGWGLQLDSVDPKIDQEKPVVQLGSPTLVSAPIPRIKLLFWGV